MQEKFAEVVLPLPLRHNLIYKIPSQWEEKSKLGVRVKVPLGSKKIIGCLLKNSEKPHFKTREILEIMGGPQLTENQLQLLQWSSAYYLNPMGEVLRHLLPPQLLQITEKKKKESSKKTETIRSENFSKENHTPTLEQQKILQSLLENFSKNSPTPHLIHGITGSGKTEIYRQAANSILKSGGQVLILVPEIGLTPQIVGYFQSLKIPLGVFHSHLTPSQKFQVWQDVSTSKINLVIATRSGIFLPFHNLKMIVIDEEHDTSYKQEERFCYHARDLALWKGEKEKILVVLGSATPSLESLQRASLGKMKLLSLNERPSGFVLPTIHLIDQRLGEKNKHEFFSEDLLVALETNLKKKEQSLIFLNRRGLAPFLLCQSCGHVPRCPACDISFTLHQGEKKTPYLKCHYCDTSIPYQPICTTCQKSTLTQMGAGTERIDKELKKIFPSARIGRIDRDTAKGQGWFKTLENMKRGEIDILVGTQMITKGHDYPNLTLVGILDADMALNLPDFRAAERTYQMLIQTSGRAGRATKPGRVLIQTYHPEHPSLMAVLHHKESEFYTQELKEREEAGYPPFKRLVEIRLSSPSSSEVIQKIRLLNEKLQKILPNSSATLLGPAPCVIEKVRNRSRWRLLIKTSAYTKIQPLLRRSLDDFMENHLSSKMKLLVNVDPVDMM